MSKLKKVIIFPNGNLAAFDDRGEQMPELQGGWIDFDALRKLAVVIAKDNPEVSGSFPFSYDPLSDYVNHYRKHPPLEEDL